MRALPQQLETELALQLKIVSGMGGEEESSQSLAASGLLVGAVFW